jgi:hypothetical protein
MPRPKDLRLANREPSSGSLKTIATRAELHDRICTLNSSYGKHKPVGVEGLMAPPLLSLDDLVKQGGAFVREVVPTRALVQSSCLSATML